MKNIQKKKKKEGGNKNLIYLFIVLCIILFSFILVSAYLANNPLENFDEKDQNRIEKETEAVKVKVKGNLKNNYGAIISHTSSSKKGIGSPNNECKSLGFDFGVAKWECEEGNWNIDEEIIAGTSITGTCEEAIWDVGTSGADGIVVKAGNPNKGGFHYAINGTSGNVSLSKDTSHITFCGYDEPPEFCEEDDCPLDYYGERYCSKVDVFKDFHNFSCLDEECVEDITPELVEQCGEDGCDDWVEYCEGEDLWRKRNCYDRGCADGECFMNESKEKEIVEECSEICGCREPVCGDNIVNQAWEQCDDGLLNGIVCIPLYSSVCTYCSTNCSDITLRGPYCGDQILQSDYEECETDIDCDDGNELTKDTCSQCNCEYEDIPFCGNGILEQGEECDDGNNDNGDGCDENCKYENIICYENIDCGINRCAGGPNYCMNDDVYQVFLKFICNFHGTSDSFCSSITEPVLIEDCGEDGCDDWVEYCEGEDLWRKRNCYDRGCADGECFMNESKEKERVEECSEICGCSKAG